MNFGERIRELRQAKQLTLRELAAQVGVGFTYISKIENHKLEVGHGPSEKLIHKLATELDGDEEELLLLAEKVPEVIRRRVMEHPEFFMALAQLSDADLSEVLKHVPSKAKRR
jgi:HTH-type transcriptional regulator, competence development regulator